MATTPDLTDHLVADLIRDAITDIADSASRISEFLRGEPDAPAPGADRDALIDTLTTLLQKVADSDDLADYVASIRAQEA